MKPLHSLMGVLKETRVGTMQFVEVFETFCREDFLGAAMVALIKTANNSILRLCKVNYLMALSPEDE